VHRVYGFVEYRVTEICRVEDTAVVRCWIVNIAIRHDRAKLRYSIDIFLERLKKTAAN